MRRGDEHLKKVGYWYSSDEPELPFPESGEWGRAEKKLILEYLRDGDVHARMRGWSTCRVCGCSNGTKDMTDGVYVWPEGLAHYVDEHDTDLPLEFKLHILEQKPVGEMGWVEYLVAFDDHRWDTTIEKVPRYVIEAGYEALRRYAHEKFAPQPEYRNTALWAVYSFPEAGGAETEED